MTNENYSAVQPDEWKINMSDAWQVLWWCRYLGLTKSQLEMAVSAVGPVIVDVKMHIESDSLLKEPAPKKAPSRASHISSRVTLARSPF
jgi:hypothetical protein